MGTLIHPTAVIDPSAELADDVEVGPYVVVEGDVVVGTGCRLMTHAFVGRHTRLGAGNVLHIGAVVGHAPQDISTTGEEDAQLLVGDGNTFREYCTVHRGSRDGGATRIGDGNFIMAQAHVAHDCQIGNRTIIAGGALLAGHVHVEDRAFVSGNVAVHQFCRIGTLAMVAGLARVNRDAPPYFMIKGDSQAYGLNKVGLERAGLTGREREEIRGAYKLLYRKGHRLDQALRMMAETYPGSPYIARLVEFIRNSQRGIVPHHRRGAPRL